MAARASRSDNETMNDISTLYDKRFRDTGLERRNAVWRVLAESFFQKLVHAEGTVLDIACGYGEFINNIRARHRLAVDINPDAALHLDPEVTFHQGPATDLSHIPAGSVSAAFTSNFLEHLRSKEEVSELFRQVRRVLKPGGRFIIMGPNIRFAYREYWDFFDHHLPLSDRTVVEGLEAAGYRIERSIDRFLPFTMNNRSPTAGFLIRAYLSMPLAWRFFGRQFLIVARSGV